MHIKKKADDTNVKDGTAFFCSPLFSPTVYFPWDVEKATYCFLEPRGS